MHWSVEKDAPARLAEPDPAVEPAALNEAATELLFEAVRAQTDIARKLRGGLLRPAEARAQRRSDQGKVARLWR